MKHIAHRIPRRLITLSFSILPSRPRAARAAECPESSPEDAQERRKLAKEWFSTARPSETAATTSSEAGLRLFVQDGGPPLHRIQPGARGRPERGHDPRLQDVQGLPGLKPDAKDREDVKGRSRRIEEKIASGKESEPASAGPAATETTAGEPAATEPAPDVLTPPPEPKPAEVVERRPESQPEPEAPRTPWNG